jgi:hypothetical protein
MLFFLDESGTDHGEAPYEVLGAVAIRERDLWNYVQAIASLEREIFGMRLRDLKSKKRDSWRGLKGKHLLQRDKFRYAAQGPTIEVARCRDMAHAFLQKGLTGEPPRREEFTAYGQAVLDFVGRLRETAGRFHVKVFASMVDPAAPRPTDDEMSRRDHAFLFERFFCYLEDTSAGAQGILVFDELERSQSLQVIRRMERYFVETETGRMRSHRIIPEPFFVHSDLTTAIQTADIVCYVLNWSYRFGRMTGVTRSELGPYLERIKPLIYKRVPDEENGQGHTVYGVTYVDDLRPRSERGGA